MRQQLQPSIRSHTYSVHPTTNHHTMNNPKKTSTHEQMSININKLINKIDLTQLTAIKTLSLIALLLAFVTSSHLTLLANGADQQQQHQQQTQSTNQAKPWLRHLRFQSANRGSNPQVAAASSGAPSSQSQSQPQSPIVRPLSPPPALPPTANTHHVAGTGSAVEVPASSIVGPAHLERGPIPHPSAGNTQPETHVQAPNQQVSTTTNRTVRTADVFKNGDGFNMFVTNTCERESMRINIKTSRPFFGVIHTRDYRTKAGCFVEGTGAVEYNMDISQSLNPADSAYCGALRGPRETPQDSEIVSLVVAIRVHKSIELSDDRFFLLNCTNRCRRADCSSQPNDRLTDRANDQSARFTRPDDPEREFAESDINKNQNSTNANQDECTIYKFPWAVSLLWCLGIMCIALLISHCVLCSSLVCRCVRKEVEEQEPSIYGDGSVVDYDAANANMKKLPASKHPYRIEYDNRDIYKTSNNYAPYCLDDEADSQITEPKRRGHKSHSKRHSHR